MDINNQKQILYDLLEGTCVDHCATPGKKRGDIIIGANKSAFMSWRPAVRFNGKLVNY